MQLIRDLVGELATRREDGAHAKAIVGRIDAELATVAALPALKN